MNDANLLTLFLLGYAVFSVILVWIVGQCCSLSHAQDGISHDTDGIRVPMTAPQSGESSGTLVDAPPVASKQVLQIMQCPDRSMWYAGLVGKTVPFEGYWISEGYKSREPAGYCNIVKFADARIIWETK